MRQSEAPYVYATEAVNIWLDGGDPRQVYDKVPDDLVDLVRASARSQAELITHWAKKYSAGAAVPRHLSEQVKRYLEARRGT